MRTMIGRTLGHYKVLEPLGAGGMGEVYRAHDGRLDREVAIKVLPAAVADDVDRLARFEREAKALARLSHPNILTIHDFGHEDGTSFAVMELLEGETLRAQIRRGALPWRRAVELGAAIADGLAVAHAHNITHRDLKPENLFLTSDGRVKILDFGLAKVREEVVADVETLTSGAPVTVAGTILGTIGYMAPEQVRGEPTDARSDVFAFGCVLYELVAGERAFTGKTEVDVLSAILMSTPSPLIESVPAVPAPLSGIVERCLEKSPQQRFQSTEDLGFALRSLLAPAPATAPEPSGETRDDGEGPSVAVLPFTNLSADPEQEYFCDGMAEEIINALAQVTGLRVVARTSAFAFKGKAADIREIGGKLDVGTVLEGSVRKSGDRLRITAQLIDVANGYHLWSERFDRRLEDVFEIQDEISLAIVEKLEVKLLGKERQAVVNRHTENLDAYTTYLQAWFHWNELTPEGYQRSRECFEEAIRIDPDYARAYSGLAVWYVSQSWWAELSPQDALAAATPLVHRALELDDTLPEAHGLLGIARGFFRRQWDAAEKSLRKAVEFGPNVAAVHGNYGAFLLVKGRFDEALAEVKLAQKLDPLSPTWSTWTCTWLAFAGERDEGVAGLEKVVSMHPHHWMPHYYLSVLYAQAARLQDAGVEAEAAVELSGGVSITVTQLANVCFLVGDRRHGDEHFELLQERARTSYVPPTFLAWVRLARQETDEAFEHLQEAARGNDPWLIFHRFVSPALHPADTRIDALLEGLGL